MANSNVRKLAPKEQLTPAEVQRVAEKLAIALEHRTQDIGLLLMLFAHLQTVADNNLPDLEFAFYNIKQVLFTGTLEADAAQERFQSNAFKNRGRLLAWPVEMEA